MLAEWLSDEEIVKRNLGECSGLESDNRVGPECARKRIFVSRKWKSTGVGANEPKR